MSILMEWTMTQPVGNRGLNDACNHGKEESSGFPPFKTQGILVPYLWLLLGSFSMKRGIICQVISTLAANDRMYGGENQATSESIWQTWVNYEGRQHTWTSLWQKTTGEWTRERNLLQREMELWTKHLMAMHVKSSPSGGKVWEGGWSWTFFPNSCSSFYYIPCVRPYIIRFPCRKKRHTISLNGARLLCWGGTQPQ